MSIEQSKKLLLTDSNNRVQAGLGDVYKISFKLEKKSVLLAFTMYLQRTSIECISLTVLVSKFCLYFFSDCEVGVF